MIKRARRVNPRPQCQPRKREWATIAVDLYRQGKSLRAIGAVVGVHQETVRHVLKRAGQKTRPPKIVTAHFEHARPCAQCLGRIGYGYRAIAKLLHLPKATACRFKKDSGAMLRARKAIAITKPLPKPKAPKLKKERPPTRVSQFQDKAAYARAMARRYYQKNKQAIYQRIKSDPNRLARHRLRSELSALLRGKASKRMARLLGCGVEELKRSLEAKFHPGMSWQNYGKWEIDHIIPCSAFNLAQPEEQQRCFHHSNLQPLWAKDNRAKFTRKPPQEHQLGGNAARWVTNQCVEGIF